MRLLLLALAAAVGVQTIALAQSNTSGDVIGTISDPSGAPIRNAVIAAWNPATGLHQAASTSKQGAFRISFLPPGRYKVTITANGFQTVETEKTVVIGSQSEVSLTLPLKTKSTSVEVLAETAGVQMEDGDLQSSFDAVSIENLPNPGSDLTFYAQLTPGAVANTRQGYGNFSIFGLPATSNLFTLNGQNDNDPFLNINKSGASNLLLGANELTEVSITANGYSAQYGQLAGAHVNYGTKSGTNTFHGNAIYNWDGRIMNANSFFSNANGVPRPFVNANQWAASVGGPIKKDKTFFFLNNEGLQVVLPSSTSPIRLPSSQFQAATLTNLMATGMSAEIPFYQQLFKTFNSATGVSRSSAVQASPYDIQGPGCGDLTILAAGTPCVVGYSAAPSAYAHEWQVAARVDELLTDRDRIYGRFQTDHGVAPAFTDPVNPLFSAASIQPEDQGQLSWTRIFSTRSTNQIVASTIYSNSSFKPANSAAANALLPYYFAVGDGSLTSLNTTETFTPQGREILQYQLVDDFSYLSGRHTFKAGLNFHRDRISDYDFGFNTGGEIYFGSLDDIYNGVLGTYGLFAQNFPAKLSQQIRTGQLGIYVEDDFRVASNLKLTFSLRADHNAIPTCPDRCFATSALPFTELDHNPDIPFNRAIQTNLRQAFRSSDWLVWQPRIGFAYSPFSSAKTALRGGIGLFGDSFAAGLVDGFVENMPQFNSMYVQGTAGYGSTPVSSNVTDGVFDIARSANQSLISAFHSGGTLGSISASNPLFLTPNLITSDAKLKLPRYYEWNFELQHQFPWDVTASVNYVGNRGVRELIGNDGLNTYCVACAPAFATFPSAPVDSRFFTVSQYQSVGVSSYNGLVFSVRQSLSEHIQFNANYSYSHSLDNISNGGFAGFASTSIVTPLSPANLRAYNWGNSDYDVRHYFSASYVVTDMFHGGSNRYLGGWTLAGTVLRRTGFYFSVVDSVTNLVGGTGTVLAYSAVDGRASCGPSAVYTNEAPCLTPGEFRPVVDQTSGLMIGLGNQTRNQYRGPGYFNTDLGISKAFRTGDRWLFSIGAQFFNLLNHPNFSTPVNDIENTLFGQITGTVSAPTSILGSLLGGDASPRLIQFHGKLTF